MATEPIYMRQKTLPERLRYLADKLIDIGVRVNEPFELVAEIGAVSMVLNLIADQYDPAQRDGLAAADPLDGSSG